MHGLMDGMSNGQINVAANDPKIKLTADTIVGDERRLKSTEAHEMGHWDTLSKDRKEKYDKLRVLYRNERKNTNDPIPKGTDSRSERILSQLSRKLEAYKKQRKAAGKPVSSHLNLAELAADSHAVGSGRTTLSEIIDSYNDDIRRDEEALHGVKLVYSMKGLGYDTKKYDAIESDISELKFRIKCLKEVKEKLN